MIINIIKFFSIQAIYALIFFLIIVLLKNIPPNAKFSKSYSITPPLPYEGNLALNERLNNAEILFKGKIHGPEAFAVYSGELYTSLVTGEVVKIVGNEIISVVKFGKACKGSYQQQICGRPLGMAFDQNGALYVADAYYGIFKVDVKTGKYEQLVSLDKEIDGKKPKMPNGIAVASNGDFYWTDSSTDFSLYDGLFEMLSDGSGRAIHYDAKTKKNKVLLDNIHFANGIVLSKDEDFIVVGESPRNRLLRYYLKGTKAGTSDVFLDGLPGISDNLRSDGHNGFFAAIALPFDTNYPYLLSLLGPYPLLRKFIARVQGLVELVFKLVDQLYPNEWAEKAVHFIGSFHILPYISQIPNKVTVLHISESGRIIDSLHALDGKIIAISDVIVFNDFVYLGSPLIDYLARVPLSNTGLQHLITTKSDIPTQSTTSKPITTKPSVKVTPSSLPSTTTPPSGKTTTQETTPVPKTTSPPPKTTSPTTTSEEEKDYASTTPPPSVTPEPKTKASPTAKAPSTTESPSSTSVPKEKPTSTATPVNKAATENLKPETKKAENKSGKESKGNK